jgi:amino acid transporter
VTEGKGPADRPVSKRQGDEAAAQALSRLGYAQELVRAMGGFSSFALSFSIISVLTGILSTYDIAIKNGGPGALGLGWPLVSVGTLVVALAMAELASAFPTAGALYHWSALLGGPGWGWFVAMMNLVGQVAIVAAIDLTCAQTAVATTNLHGSPTLWIFSGVVASHAVFNLTSVRLVGWLNDLSATVHVVGVAVLCGVLFLAGRANPFAFALDTEFTARSDGNYALGFVNSLLLGMWTFTGFDASAHVSEETHDPARRAPWGIVSSVVVSAVAGYALLIAITLAIVDLPGTAMRDNAALYILRRAVGQGWGSLAMGLGIVAMWFCGLSAVTSASRTLYAFARDGGLPAARRLRSVSARWRTPHIAILAVTLVSLLLGLSSAGLSDDQFLAVASLATTALYVSYAVPIALGAVARHRGRWRVMGPWHLGAAGIPLAWGAVAWAAFVLVAFAIPHQGAYAVLLLVIAATLALSYVVFVRGKFAGPRIALNAVEGGEA